ncbi:MAG: transglycosylase domain-containing protein, partial [Chloroflexota bacterium]|nr:transglycosylase domain-containing protein [Chloroflexota bacterium]
MFIGVVLAIIVGSIVLFQYNKIAGDLPNIEDLREQAAHFETTRILDREGNELYEILDPTAGRRTYVPLADISPYLVAATVATEDSHFYSHPGYDALAIMRAFWQNLTSDAIVSGASTITQQLTRMLVLSPEESSRRTYARKLREAILAAEVTRRYSKDEILELYLNEIYYSNLAYGVEAAAQTYFGISAKNLDLVQASFLAGIPQLPAVYDVYTNRDLTLRRQEQVLVLMYQLSQEQGCIYVSNNQQDICIGPGEVAAVTEEMKDYQFQYSGIEMRYPHWVNYIHSLLEELYDAQTIYRSGFTVYTTLDPGLQDAAQQIVQEQIANLAGHSVSNGALVAVRPNNGEILAMVGSADFGNEGIQGQINMSISPRQPGSSIKPLTYLAAFEKGWTPATLIWDVRSEFPPSGDPNDPRPPYVPVNYDERYHGPVTVRFALANSYNIPAVKTLDYVGIYDNPLTSNQDGFIAFARRMGITTLTRDDYGLSLTLGGGDVTLLEMTGAYAVMANGGRRIPPVAITKIEDHEKNVVYEYHPPAGEQVIRPEHAYLISSILSDNGARTPAFGPNSVLNLPFTAAAKTGTTNDFRDNWTMGYTPNIAVGVWVGNADYTSMQNTSGLTGAAPIWASFMQTAIQQLTGGNPSSFVKPAGVVERVICAVSGTEPSA